MYDFNKNGRSDKSIRTETDSESVPVIRAPSPRIFWSTDNCLQHVLFDIKAKFDPPSSLGRIEFWYGFELHLEIAYQYI